MIQADVLNPPTLYLKTALFSLTGGNKDYRAIAKHTGDAVTL